VKPSTLISMFGQCNKLTTLYLRGGNLEGTGGDSPPKFEVGMTAHAFVPPIIWEVVLSDVRESMKRVKKVLFLWGKGCVRYLTK